MEYFSATVKLYTDMEILVEIARRTEIRFE